MRTILAIASLLTACSAAPASQTRNDSVAAAPANSGPFAELESYFSRALAFEAPDELFTLREIREPDAQGPCELDALAGKVDAATHAGHANHSYVETYDQRNCPVYQSATRSDAQGQLTLTIDGLYGEWRRNMWRSAFTNGVNSGYSSGEWIDTPEDALESNKQAVQEFDQEGRLVREVSQEGTQRRVVSYDYDHEGRTLAIWRDEGNGLRRIEAYGYGPNGLELVQYFDSSGQIVREMRYEYDDQGVLRSTTTRSLATNTGYPAYARDEFDANGNPTSSTTDQNGDGRTDAEWRQEFSDYGMTYRRDRYVFEGIEHVTEWTASYNPDGRLLRSRSVMKVGDRVERLELSGAQRDQKGRWRNVRLTKDAEGIFGDMDVSTDEHFLFSCQLEISGGTITCESLTTQAYDAHLNPIQYCTSAEAKVSCQRYVYSPNGYVVTELFDDDDDGQAERRSEYRYDVDYVDRLVGYLTPQRWAQIQQTPAPAQNIDLPEYED